MDRKKSRTYQAMASALRERLGDREYCIGIDPGVGSLGVAVVALEPGEDGELTATDIVYAGTRLFESSEDSSFRFGKRNLRNIRRHGKNRLIYLWKVLSERGLMISVPEEHDDCEVRFSSSVIGSNPYDLRLKGLEEELSLEELGRAIYHIAGHRGYEGRRVVEDDEDIEPSFLFEVTDRICRETGVDTFIEVLEEFNRDKFIGYRNTATNAALCRMPTPTRTLIRNEFERIMSVQKVFHPDILTDDYIEEIRKGIFHENPQIDTPPGRCPFFPEEQKLPKASFLNEERRIMEALINVRLFPTENEGKRRCSCEICLSDDDRNLLFSDLRKGNDLTVSRFRELLPELRNYCIVLPGTDRKDPKIQGFRFIELEERPFFSAMDDEERDAFITLFINTSNDNMLRRRLKDEYSLSDEDTEWVMKRLVLVGDYAPTGRTAMEIIYDIMVKENRNYISAKKTAISSGLLPDITDSRVFDRLPYYGEVITSNVKPVAAKYFHPFFKERTKEPGFHKPNTAREEEEFGRIPNPVVHRSLNEVRKFINELMDIFGKKPKHITVEIAKELKAGKAVRNRMTIENAKRNRENMELFEKYCVPNGLGRHYIRMFRLLEAQNWTCPYSLRKISIDDVINGRVDIDHIFPFSETTDSTLSNLVVSDRYCNQVQKGDRIPLTAFGGDSEKWNEIMNYIDATPGMRSKKWRFEMNDADYTGYLASHTFLSRFITDNAYVARVMCAYLRCLFPVKERLFAVDSIRGAETALLRRAWDLNGITEKLRILHKPGEDDSGFDVKDRTDARHHAIDAVVAAYFTPSYKNWIHIQAQMRMPHERISANLPLPVHYRNADTSSYNEMKRAFRKHVEDFIIDSAYVSRKNDTGKNGELLKDTRYKVFAHTDNDVLMLTRKYVKNIKASKFFGVGAQAVEHYFKPRMPSWLTDEEKAELEKMAEYNSELFRNVLACREKAEELLMKEQMDNAGAGKKVRSVTEKMIVTKSLAMAGGRFYFTAPRKSNKVLLLQQGDTCFVQDTGENYSLDLYHDDKGKLRAEVVRKININTRGWTPEYVRKGYSLLERIYVKDILELDSTSFEDAVTGRDVVCSIKANNAPSGKTLICVKCFTETGSVVSVHFDSLNASKVNDNGTMPVAIFGRINVRKVVLSSAGLVCYRSGIFKDRE